MALVDKQKTEQKGTDDEIAVSNEAWMPFTAVGYFVVCPFLAVLHEHGIKIVPYRIPINHCITPTRSGSLKLPPFFGLPAVIVAVFHA